MNTSEAVTILCNSLEARWPQRFDGFSSSAGNAFKDAVEAEMVRRGYEVTWHGNRTEISYLKPSQVSPTEDW